ncbi:MAG: S-methyl-5-thioribose-1-phosphate isomerase [Bacillota bacterium]|jgi:methylthioribose-1-phosphate isomerase
MKDISPVEYRDGTVVLLDQRALPGEVRYVQCRTVTEMAEAIRNLTVRGAPAIGVSAAYGMAMAARQAPGDLQVALDEAASMLAGTRPTAVNLFWAINRMQAKARGLVGMPREEVVAVLENEAKAIHDEDVSMNRRIGHHGAGLIREGAGVLTHCNAGALATGGFGTALGVVRAAFEAGTRFRVLATETRPVLQGARLTTWELTQDGIPVTLITDSMAAHFMAVGQVDLVVVGADRIAANGDVANKIGTYGLSVLARAHGIPLYVAAPCSTMDLSIPDGTSIAIEERDPEEVRSIGGKSVAPREVPVLNPAFDITPARYITGIISERGVLRPPYEMSLKAAMLD